MVSKSLNMLKKFLKKHKYKISFLFLLVLLAVVVHFVAVPAYREYRMKKLISSMEPVEEESTFQHPLEQKEN